MSGTEPSAASGDQPASTDRTGTSGGPGASGGAGGDWSGPGGAGDGGIDLPPGAPGGRIFSLENRRAPGLYFVAWLLGLTGAALLLIGLLSGGQAGGVLFLLGLAALGPGCAAGCGYQVVARADRHPDAYRGPSPALLFWPPAILTVGLVFLLQVFRLSDSATPAGALLAQILVAGSYALFVLLAVVRTRALRWTDMGWPGREADIRRLLGDIGLGIAMAAPIWLVTQIGGTLLALALDVRLDLPLPAPSTGPEAIAIACAAVIVAPVGEEVFFRGFALTAWRRDLGAAPALLRSTLFFALVHIANVSSNTAGEGLKLALLQFAVILPIGYVLGWLFLRRGIIASMAGHMTFNAITIALLLAYRGT